MTSDDRFRRVRLDRRALWREDAGGGGLRSKTHRFMPVIDNESSTRWHVYLVRVASGYAATHRCSGEPEAPIDPDT